MCVQPPNIKQQRLNLLRLLACLHTCLSQYPILAPYFLVCTDTMPPKDECYTTVWNSGFLTGTKASGCRTRHHGNGRPAGQKSLLAASATSSSAAPQSQMLTRWRGHLHTHKRQRAQTTWSARPKGKQHGRLPQQSKHQAAGRHHGTREGCVHNQSSLSHPRSRQTSLSNEGLCQ